MAKRTKKDEFSLETNKDRERFYKKMDKDQLALFNSIQDNIFTFCEAKSGTGKTVVSINSLLHLLFTNNINHIVYIQKASDRYLEHGFLPGSAEEKTFALWTPFYEAMATLGYQPSMVDKFREQESIILTTDSNLRGINFEKCGIILDECIDGQARIAIENGNILINTLYLMQQKGEQLPKALTFNENTKTTEYKQIKTIKYKGEKETRTIKFSNKTVKCTDNHPFLTIHGWKRADELNIGDILIASNHNSNQMPIMLNDDQEQILIGSYLGDGGITKQGINKYACKLVHGEQQKDYLLWKSKILNCENTLNESKSGYCDNKIYSTRINTFISELPLKTEGGRKNLHIPQEIIDKLDERALAVWYMDDGSCSSKFNSIMIWCSAFDLDSITRLVLKLNTYNLYPTISKSKGFNYLRFNVNNSKILCNLIAPYMCETMKYKLFPQYRDVKLYNWNCIIDNFGYTVITKIINNRKVIPVYDLEIEDNHNFCIVSSRQPVKITTPGIFVHNCENMDTETLKLIFTRCHDDCHIVMLGDRLQKDNKGNHNQDFVEYGDYLANSSVGNKCYLTKNYRGKFSQLAEEFKEEL